MISYWRFVDLAAFLFRSSQWSLDDQEDRGNKLLRNVCNYHSTKASYPTILNPTMWKPQIILRSHPIAPIPNQISPDHTLLHHFLVSPTSKLRLTACSGHTQTHVKSSSHLPLGCPLSLPSASCYVIACWAARRECICANCTCQFFLRYENFSPVCPRCVLTTASHYA
jgi:hypothetical protein